MNNLQKLLENEEEFIYNNENAIAKLMGLPDNSNIHDVRFNNNFFLVQYEFAGQYYSNSTSLANYIKFRGQYEKNV